MIETAIGLSALLAYFTYTGMKLSSEHVAVKLFYLIIAASVAIVLCRETIPTTYPKLAAVVVYSLIGTIVYFVVRMGKEAIQSFRK